MVSGFYNNIYIAYYSKNRNKGKSLKIINSSPKYVVKKSKGNIVHTEKSIAENVKSILVEVGKINGEILAESDIYADLGVESVNSISILLALEDKFNIAIDDNEFIQARTLSKLIELVRI